MGLEVRPVSGFLAIPALPRVGQANDEDAQLSKLGCANYAAALAERPSALQIGIRNFEFRVWSLPERFCSVGQTCTGELKSGGSRH